MMSFVIYAVSLTCGTGLDLLYQPEVVRLYLSLLRLSQNQNTLEAAGGALQNLSAGQWAVSWSITDIKLSLFTWLTYIVWSVTIRLEF